MKSDIAQNLETHSRITGLLFKLQGDKELLSFNLGANLCKIHPEECRAMQIEQFDRVLLPPTLKQ
jgi:hypothetical protein